MPTYTRSLKIHSDVLDDLKLVKRILGTDSLSDTIRDLMNARGYHPKWIEQMRKVLVQKPEEMRVGKE